MGVFLEFYCIITSNFLLGQAQSPGMLMLSGFFLGIGGAIFQWVLLLYPNTFQKTKLV